MEILKKVRVYDFVKYSSYGLAISIVLIIASFALLAVKGFNLGIDFAGGSVVQLQYKEAAPLAQIRALLAQDERFKNTQVSEFGSKEEVLLKIPYIPTNVDEDIAQDILKLLESSGSFELRRMDSVGPKVGDELKQNGIIALIFALSAMMIYISFRYEWRFSLAGVLALMHDVIIVSGAVILAGIDFNLDVLAALLTIIGYSINDTIIIFDRIREQMMSRRQKDMRYVINEAVSCTLSRTILTSLTVFFVVLTLYLFGGEIIIGFSFPMLVGVIAATCSSMFVAPRLALLFGFSLDEYYKKESKKLKRQEEKKRLRAMYEQGTL
ncbi:MULTISPECIES: protein translocase subunit SecF [Helicobacter]|uniref:Protein-export membrane protein SecF n=1 Tax=Helicobacter typhlonius TaxID=76936 RepID=A0A099UD91_9HELI|nr:MULTISPECIES: protein translocase subunit SecF [Helicobacter]TLD78516.1 protein translocase subunit SecF [Helicobacter typhlonius]TLD88819.1 protein translocase subunit SecF [Helicobacter sp. MIT 03-1616]CUU39781.1 Protein-export membrane protein SecF (TC 3.A.5.1.1) [Helicobacter typhlonius]